VLIHPWDEPPADGDALAFVRRTAFGHLVAPGRREIPVVVPTQYVVDEAAAGAAFPDVLLHLARPNPVWDALAESPTVVLSVAGEWAYVPAAWKAIGDEDPSLGIPTTYYAAVQLIATAHVLDDVETCRAASATRCARTGQWRRRSVGARTQVGRHSRVAPVGAGREGEVQVRRQRRRRASCRGRRSIGFARGSRRCRRSRARAALARYLMTPSGFGAMLTDRRVVMP
jgi:hypothetical protein